MKRLLETTSAMALLGLGACAVVPPPAITNAGITPNIINPGQSISVSYALDYQGKVTDIQQIEILGFPNNTVQASTPTRLPLPAAGHAITQTPLVVQAPAADGTYPLTMKVTYKGGQVMTAPLGDLQILDVPTRFELAQFEPGSHSPDQCVGPFVQRDFKYAVADDNGADDLKDVELSTVGTQPFAVMAPPVNIVVTSSANYATTVTSIAPAPVPRGMPSYSNLMMARADGAAPAPFQTTVLLNSPHNPNSIREVVTTPVLVSCSVPSPMQWHLILNGVNLAAYNQASVIVPSRQVEYVSAK